MKSKSAKTLSWVLIVLGIVMIIAAMVLVVHNKQDDDFADENSKEGYANVLSIIEDIQMGIKMPGEDDAFAYDGDSPDLID